MIKSTVVVVSLDHFDPALLDGPARAIVDGKLVGLPTDTVYAVATNADKPAALEKLHGLCGRSPSDPLTLLISDSDDVARFVEHVPPVANRLMNTFWPGPLTLVLPKKGGGSVSLRYPANKIALAVIQKAAVPVAAPSASMPGRPPVTTAAELDLAFRDKLEFIVDGGMSSATGLSTVMRCSQKGFNVVRAGMVSAEALEESVARCILFVCLGNTCRSPMAVGLVRKALADHFHVPENMLIKAGYNVKSAGTSATVGEPMSEYAKAVLHEKNCDSGVHASQPISSLLIKEADVVFVMNESQRTAILSMVPQAAGRVELLDREGKSIEDPFGGTLEEYRRAADRIVKSIPGLVKRIIS
jgi:tRNA threonylcarbamoyl adenosine modification protein (Sua5/YciO/YrdC/YwlC family)